MEALDPEPLLRFLHEQGVEHILIGGVAVAAHGYRRPSKDLDIVPSPDGDNLSRLALALMALHARPAELGAFGADEMPADATRIEDLALGVNFRLKTDLGALDIMQWISGIDIPISMHSSIATRSPSSSTTCRFGTAASLASVP